MHFHYHLQREELLVVLAGTIALKTANGWQNVGEGEVVAFPRGERGAHGYENRTKERVRLLMFSEQNAPNVSVYPDTNEVVGTGTSVPAGARTTHSALARSSVGSLASKADRFIDRPAS